MTGDGPRLSISNRSGYTSLLDSGPQFDEVRAAPISLFEAGRVRITHKATITGKTWLARFENHTSEKHLRRYTLDLPRSKCSFKVVPMGTPPGSGGLAYRLIDPRFLDLYIKVKIEENTAWIISFKQSDYSDEGTK